MGIRQSASTVTPKQYFNTEIDFDIFTLRFADYAQNVDSLNNLVLKENLSRNVT